MPNATLEQATETFPECLVSLARSNLKLNLIAYLKPPREIAFGSRGYESWTHIFPADRRDLVWEIRSETDIGQCDVTVESMQQYHGESKFVYSWSVDEEVPRYKRFRGKRTAVDVRLSDGKQFVIHMSRATVEPEIRRKSRKLGSKISSKEYNEFQYARE